MSDTRSVRERDPARWRFFGAWLAVTAAAATMLFLYKWLGSLAEGGHEYWLSPFITEFTGVFGAALLFFPLRAMVYRVPLLDRGRLIVRRLPLYAVAVVLFGATATTWMWGSRIVIFRLAGLGHYDYGRMPLRYFMEFPVQLIAFGVMVGALHAARQIAAMRQSELNAARAQLQNLRLQLQPHFLFNALNTISSTMYDDPGAADEMLDRLSELLRVSLRTTQTDEVPLSTELDTLDCYLGIMRARFGDRLQVAIDVDPAVRGVLVPSMILQPIVENAVRHGNAERSGRGAIAIRARQDGGALSIDITDDGPGTPVVEPGIGLSTTIERLRILYGDEQRFETRSTERGFTVAIRVPASREQ